MATERSEVLRRRILSLIAGLSPGEKLPAERALGEQFGVARETLRRTLDDLAEEGYLDRRQGIGTFVTRPKLTQSFRVQSFTEDMRARRMSSSSKLLSHRRRMAGARIASRLQISPGEEVITLRRLRFADGEPMALENVSMPTSLLPDFDAEKLGDSSLYATLFREYGIDIVAGTQTMEATVTDVEESAILEVAPLSPAILVDRVTWTASGQRVESVRSIYRGDRYKIQVDLSGAQRPMEATWMSPTDANRPLPRI
jgi:GntR family transcriptional regulator